MIVAGIDPSGSQTGLRQRAAAGVQRAANLGVQIVMAAFHHRGNA